MRASDERKGDLKLRKFQVEAETAGEEAGAGKRGLITIDAPTGAGKTLAALLAVWNSGPGSNRFSMFVYPTNQLVEDQARTLSHLIERAGLSTRGSEVVRVITSSSLEREAEDKGFKSHGRAFLSILKEMKGGILLTNPEMLLILIKGTPKFFKHDAIFREIFSSLSSLVIDEVHLYYGFALANLTHALYMLRNKVDLVVAMSATPSGLQEIAEIFRDSRLHHMAIRAERLDWWEDDPDEEWVPVRLPGKLSIVYGSPKTLWSEDDLDLMVNLCEETYSTLENLELPRGAVRLLVLVNSVVFAELLAQKLESQLGVEVSKIHGLVPPKARRAEGEIVVGTRAADVGIDFHTLGVVFEAIDAPTFIQRLGRGCRKFPGLAWSVLSPDKAAAVSARLRERSTYSELIATVSDLMSSPEVYGEFLRSKWAAVIYGSTLMALLDLTTKKVQPMYDSGVCKWKRLEGLAADLGLPPQVRDALNCRDNCPQALTKLAASEEPFIKALISSLMRGATLSFKAEFLLPEGEPIEWRVSISDLWKLDFRVEERDGEPVIVVREIRPKGQPVKIILMSGGLEEIQILKEKYFSVISCDELLSEGLKRILKGQPAILVRYPSDWRFQSLPAMMVECSNCKIVVGPDALLQDFKLRNE